MNKQDIEQLDWRFEAVWHDYPVKRDKALAKRAFNAIPNMTEQLFTSILDAIKEQKTSEEWRKLDGKYIPSLSKWLNNERWYDELPKTPLKLSNSPVQQQMIIGGHSSVEEWQKAYTGNLAEFLQEIRESPDKYRHFIECNHRFMSPDLSSLMKDAINPTKTDESTDTPW